MARNMIVRLGVDASDFKKKMEQAGAVAASAGKRIKKELSVQDLGSQVSSIMGWSGAATGVGSITADTVGQAQSQLATLRSYRDQLASQGFDDLQFGMVSERIKELEYDLNVYEQSLNQTVGAERRAARESDALGNSARRTGSAVSDVSQDTENMGQASRRSESFLSRAARALRSMGSSGRQLGSVSGSVRQIGDSASRSNLSVEKMLRSIRNISVVSFAFRVARSLFGEFSTVVRNYISQNAQLQAQVKGLSSSLGQALAPAINVVVNALSYVLPYVVGVSNAIGQLLGALFGSGWTAATKGAQQTAAATGGAAAAQKELNRQLMSFDEINKLNGNTDSSRAGGGGAGTATTPIEAKTPAWLERFKKTFSDLFNSDEFQAANIGGKLGMSLQAGLDWLGNEGLIFDWRGVGTKLREGLDSALGSGWVESLFRTLGIYLGGFSDFVLGLMGGEWEELKTAYQNEGLLGAAAYVLGIFSGFQGSQIGAVFSKILAPFFSGLGKYFREHGQNAIAGFFEGIGDWMNNVGTWIKENFTDPVINTTKALLGIHSPSTVFASMGEDCMAGLGNGFSNGVNWVLEKLNDLKERVLSIADNLKSAFSFEWRLPSLKLPHLQVHWDPVDNVLANFFGVTAFPRLSVSWFARGGILDGAQIFGRMGSTLLGGGEAGREAVLPLDRNTDWMDQVAERVVAMLGFQSGGDVNVTIPVTLDGDVITKVVARNLRQRARATGGSPW